MGGVGQAIWVESSNDNLIQSNTLDGNSLASGVAVVANSAASDGNIIKANTVTDCNLGVRICGSFTYAVSNTTAEGNEFTGCGNAVNLNSDGGALSNLTITKNKCQSSTAAAIAVVKSPTGSSITISSNDISGNVGGVYVGASADASLVTAGPNNSIVNNTSYGAKNLHTGTLNAQGNWWGTAVESEIEALTIESPGDIDFSSWLTSAPSSTGLAAEPDILPTVATSAATDVSFTSSTLNGNLTGVGTATQVDVWFEWGTTTSYGQTTSFETKTTTGTFTAGLTGLTENTDYHFRAVARSADGTSYGNDATFHTIKAPAVTTEAATDLDFTSATLNGTLDDMGSASSVAVSFEWDTDSGAPYANEATATESPMSATGTFHADLTGLTQGQTYYFRAKAVGDGTVYGDELSFTTTAERVGISVSPTSIDFGSILAGQSSDSKTVTVTNEGNVVEQFTASLSSESPADFYTDNLAIDSGTVSAWLATNVAVDGTSTPGLVLSMPIDVLTGPKTATITFIAQKQP